MSLHTCEHKREKLFTSNTEEETLHECDVCKQRFSQSSHLAEHQRTHTNNKRYECQVCSKSFARSSNLLRHKATHTGDKPYECDVCNKEVSHIKQFIDTQ